MSIVRLLDVLEESVINVVNVTGTRSKRSGSIHAHLRCRTKRVRAKLHEMKAES